MLNRAGWRRAAAAGHDLDSAVTAKAATGPGFPSPAEAIIFISNLPIFAVFLVASERVHCAVGTLEIFEQVRLQFDTWNGFRESHLNLCCLSFRARFFFLFDELGCAQIRQSFP